MQSGTERKLPVFLKRLMQGFVTYALLCAIMWSLQRFLMYHPFVMPDMQPPEAYGLTGFREISLTASDGVKLSAWYGEAKGENPTLVHFHGNGGNLTHRVNYFKVLSEAGYGVLALDYRGYGKSEGKPTEQGLYRDGRAAMEHALGPLQILASDLIIYGESIGTAVAVQMAEEYDSGGLVLQSPFTSMVEMGAQRYPWLPVRLLVEDRFDSIAKLPRVHEKLLIMHGEDDVVVPVSEGRAMLAAANEPKKGVFLPGYGHNDMSASAMRDALADFIAAN